MPDLAIRTGFLYDGTGGAPHQNVTIVVHAGRIERIVSNDEPIAADRLLEAAAVTPGLINSHVHLEMGGQSNTQSVYVLEAPIDITLRAAKYARDSLLAGVTTVRDLGGRESNAIALREAIGRGEHLGPTIIAAGKAICMTGGHGHFIGRETDGPWDARKAVREQLKAGASCIKLIATGGVLTRGAVPGIDQLTEEEMRAAITEATTHGLRVAAHAIGTNGIKNALRAGVTSIEHGHLLDDEAIALFHERGAYLVPTLAAIKCIVENAKDGGMPEFVLRKAEALYESASANIAKAWKGGVRIAGGSDAGTPFNYHHRYDYELELMSTMLGMSPNEALCAATAVAGELLGVEAGIIDHGKPADLLLLDGDLETNTHALRAPNAVIKHGGVVSAAA